MIMLLLLFVIPASLSLAFLPARRPLCDYDRLRPLRLRASTGDNAEADGGLPETPLRGDGERRATATDTGTPIGWQGVGGMLFNDALQRSGRADLSVGPGNRYSDFRGNDVVRRVDPTVRRWLLETLPSLDGDARLEAYAEGLTGLGFRPSSASVWELRYEDLGFVAASHRRYLHEKLMGEDPPTWPTPSPHAHAPNPY